MRERPERLRRSDRFYVRFTFPILTSYERQVERLQETGFLQFEFPDDRKLVLVGSGMFPGRQPFRKTRIQQDKANGWARC